MTALQTRIGAIVGTGKTFLAVSSNMAKALESNHPNSTARWPNDLGDGNFTRGIISCNDSYFVAKTALAVGDKILMSEWGTGQRFRCLDYKRTLAFTAPAEQTATQYFANQSEFTGNTTAAFPTFSLWLAKYCVAVCSAGAVNASVLL